MTGEVVTGTEERLATGDAVNVAARLEQAAQPGEVLIGQPTLALVRDAVEVEPVEPLELKGKAEPVPAYRLLRVRDAPERRHEARFVGRERELALAAGGMGARAGRAALRAGDGRRRCRASASLGWSRRFWLRSRRRSSAAAASPTARGSPTGRSSRC